MNRTLALLLVLAACGGDDAPDPVEGAYARLGDVMPGATSEQKATFVRGQQKAQHVFTAEEGLGPDFNITSCAFCHEKPLAGGGAARYRNFLLVGQKLPDGSYVPLGTNGVQTQYSLDGVRTSTDPGVNHAAGRNAIPFFGVGLLGEISEEVILERADPDDADGDGISGRPNYDRGFVGRFGRKSQTVSIEGFIRGPLFNHMGITSNPLPDSLRDKLPVPSPRFARSRRSSGKHTRQASAPDEPIVDSDGVPDPELAPEELFDIVSWAMLLAAPLPDAPTEETKAGQALFGRIGCDGCHVPALEGPRGLVTAYTDLLLHDMGDELADGIVMGVATGSEFRTQPLWGVAASPPFLHDGRADTLDEAIRLHGGEAQRSADAYAALPDVERTRVVAFLESLGGADQKSEGLLAPDAPLPEPGQLGCHEPALSPAEVIRFEAGRRLFDRDFSLTAGLGPFFNGDSCRACHFQGAVGGGGPLDVDVTRQGILDGTGAWIEPGGGTMAHRHSVFAERPDTDPETTHFEGRQTPPLFGLGLVERVPRAAIEALADPDDLDGDGISGRAQVLPDGRLGRFGWKANVPSLAEFTRDAMSNECGITVPAVDGMTFGFTEDVDERPDPEITVEELDTLTFFMQRLAAPTPSSPGTAGQAAFERAGCEGCHVPELPTEDGGTLRAYSDFLLHDVAPLDYRGIKDADASTREFRTPPLWGLGTSAPYMHDGQAASIDAAIRAHHGEAKSSRETYEAMSAGDRAAVLSFLESL